MSVAGDSRAAAAGAMTDATPGTQLGRAREAQNLTAADVARQLKLSVWQIEALESGRYDQLPGPVFVRGFIRNYARLLKLDPEDLLRAVAGDLPQAAPRPEAPPSRDIPFPTSSTTWRWQKYALGAAVIVAMLAVYEFYWNEAEKETELPAPTATAEVETEASKPPAPPAPQKAASAQGVRPAATSTAPTSTAAASKGAASKTVLSETRDPSSAASAAQKSGVPAAPGERELRFVFNEESWVEVRDRDDKTIFYRLNRAGTAQRVTGMPPLSVVVGNSQGVTMTYEGKSVDLARHTKFDVARLTLE